ncbi:MAG TPA: DUF3040 domain-containing protein [Streptosporangiaceae bacterium]|jgi:type VI protein secretion system component VasF
MALSMEEERILTGIASQLSEDDPALARRLSRFGRDRRRRRRRVRLVVAIAVAVVVIVAAATVAVVLIVT